MDFLARLGLSIHNGAINTNIRNYLGRAMAATEEYHADLIRSLSGGEEPKNICKDKADWVCSLGALASYKVLLFLNGFF